MILLNLLEMYGHASHIGRAYSLKFGKKDLTGDKKQGNECKRLVQRGCRMEERWREERVREKTREVEGGGSRDSQDLWLTIRGVRRNPIFTKRMKTLLSYPL